MIRLMTSKKSKENQYIIKVSNSFFSLTLENTYHLHEDFKLIHGVVDTTYWEENKTIRNQNYIFESYILPVNKIVCLDTVKILFYVELNEYLDKNKTFYYQGRVYHLKNKHPYCVATSTEKGYSAKNITKKQILENGTICSCIDVNHLAKHLK